MRSKPLIARIRAYTLPELARAQGIKPADYAAFVADIIERANNGELRITTVTIDGWQVPVVAPCLADVPQPKGTST